MRQPNGYDEHRIGGLACHDGRRMTAPVSGILGSDIGVYEFPPFAVTPESRALEQARRDNRHAAIVAIAAGRHVRPGLAVINAESYESPYGPPVLQVATEHGGRIRAAARQGLAARLTRKNATTVVRKAPKE